MNAIEDIARENVWEALCFALREWHGPIVRCICVSAGEVISNFFVVGNELILLALARRPITQARRHAGIHKKLTDANPFPHI